MCAFNTGGRHIRIMGTKGEIVGEMGDDSVRLFDFYTRDAVRIKSTDVITDQAIDGGHGGGDCGIIRTFCKYITGDYHGNSLTNIDTSIESHLIAFAAEESRLNHTVIDMKEYKQRFLEEQK